MIRDQQVRSVRLYRNGQLLDEAVALSQQVSASVDEVAGATDEQSALIFEFEMQLQSVQEQIQETGTKSG